MQLNETFLHLIQTNYNIHKHSLKEALWFIVIMWMPRPTHTHIYYIDTAHILAAALKYKLINSIGIVGSVGLLNDDDDDNDGDDDLCFGLGLLDRIKRQRQRAEKRRLVHSLRHA